ncbi:MAG: pilus assembly protein [Deltaproteobacteria bacterium]|nr:pilus assembly protein [Deltaproteobacteria bacterium]
MGDIVTRCAGGGQKTAPEWLEHKARRRRLADDSGQAMVESALVMPLMLFLILGVVQLAMMQHARIMVEYAAYKAARAGIVWHADRPIMESAAIIALMPTMEGLFKEHDLANPMRVLKRVVMRAALYQANRRLPQAIDLLRNGTDRLIDKIGSKAEQPNSTVDEFKDVLKQGKDKLLDIAQDEADKALQEKISDALGNGDDKLVSVEILSPKVSDFRGGHDAPGKIGLRNYEIDFDDFSKRAETRLTIRVRYLYTMRIPFANWVIHNAWIASKAGKELYGAVWNPQENVPGETGFRNVAPATPSVPSNPLYRRLAALGREGIYMIPLEATYTMRMQSNPYKTSLQVQ